MDFPRRIFIALGEPSDVSSVASDDLRRQEAIRKCKDVERQTKQLEDVIADLRRQNSDIRTRNEALQAAIILLVFIFVISIGIAIWLCLNSQIQAPDALPAPSPSPPSQPSAAPPHDCRRGCGPADYSEFQDFERWRHRSMRGFCFN
jgi:hypothetical protein